MQPYRLSYGHQNCPDRELNSSGSRTCSQPIKTADRLVKPLKERQGYQRVFQPGHGRWLMINLPSGAIGYKRRRPLGLRRSGSGLRLKMKNHRHEMGFHLLRNSATDAVRFGTVCSLIRSARPICIHASAAQRRVKASKSTLLRPLPAGIFLQHNTEKRRTPMFR